MNRIVSILFLLFFTTSLFAHEAPVPKGHQIKVKLTNYPENKLVLGFHYGNKQFVKDTVELAADGYFHFDADTLLPCGVYLLVLIPDNSFIQMLVPETDQEFTVTTDAKDNVAKMQVKGSKENELFYGYLKYLNERRPIADSLKNQITELHGTSPQDSIRLSNEINQVDQEVKDYQNKLLKEHPDNLATKVVRAAIEPTVPDFEGDPVDVQKRKYYYYRDHYFDNIDLADGCMLYSPVLYSKLDQYVNKITPQHPDSICKAIDVVVDKIKDAPDTYKYYLIHFLNYFAKSKVVGMDGVYVHIAKTYYCTGKAPWANEEDLEKICDNADRLEPILIGKTAPNLTVKDQKNQPISLWDVDADYTVLFFWAPDCSHCKKAAPHMVEFAKKFKDRGVKIFNICTAVGEEANDCWEGVKEKEFSDFYFINTWDPYIQSKYKTLYDIRSTPQIFILDREHEILMKRIGAEQIEEVMEQVMQFQKDKKAKESGN
ncbi:MAG: redoxin domain-containing protein [Saprospiraceae bacterium]